MVCQTQYVLTQIPRDFMFQLSIPEFSDLKFQNGTSSLGKREILRYHFGTLELGKHFPFQNKKDFPLSVVYKPRPKVSSA